MFKQAQNPQIEELTKSYRERAFPLGDILPVKINEVKSCVWCLSPLKGAQRKWCSQECIDSALAWGYPQKEASLHVLMVRQDFKCNGCQFDYSPFLQKALDYINRHRKNIDPTTVRNRISERLMKVLKQVTPRLNAPEVDHIIAISKGGQAIGLSNHQILCYACHKAKSKKDNSGPRKK